MERLNVTTEILEPEEARARLPRLRPLLRDLARDTRRLREIHGQLVEAAGTCDAEQTGILRDEVRALETACLLTLKEVNLLGAYVKDPESGLVDFYTWRDGDLAFLCWRMDEPDLTTWHGLHEGLVGRKPLAGEAGLPASDPDAV
jgi:hypothetical protein